jgi:Flp pilus assembly protein TadG
MSATPHFAPASAARRFRDDERGAVAMVFGLVLTLLVGAVGYGVDLTRQTDMRNRVQNAANVTCALVNQQMARGTQATLPQRVAAITSAANQNLTSNLTAQGLQSVAPSLTIASNGATTIAANTTLQTTLMAAVGISTMPVTVNVTCPPPSFVTQNPGDLILRETFETPIAGYSSGWVYVQNYNGWTTTNEGVEISSGYKGGAPQGSYVGELVSDYNVAMTRKVTLAAGTYELRYWYQSGPWSLVWQFETEVGRMPICSNSASQVAWTSSVEDGDWNRVGVYLSADSANWLATNVNATTKPTNQNWRPSDLVDVCIHADGWIERSVTINVSIAGDYWLTFAGQGTGASYEGAQVDDIRLCVQTCSGSRTLAPFETQGTSIFQDGFESPYQSGTNMFSVQLDDQWTVKPVNTVQIGTINSPAEGRQFVELDDNGASSNRSMGVKLLLAPGTYQVAYWYRSRVTFSSLASGVPRCGATDAAASSGYPTGTASGAYVTSSNGSATETLNLNTNQMGVYFDSDLTTTESARPVNPIEVCKYSSTWAQRFVTVSVSQPRFYWLSFRGEGAQDAYGPLLDRVRLCAVRCSDGSSQTPITIAP